MLYSRTLNGQQIFFDEHGIRSTTKPSIVCLAGLGQDHRAFHFILPFLIDHFHVVRICWRGHGVNRDPIDKFSVEDLADDSIALLDSLDIETFVTLSHSHGSWCAMEMAARLGKDRVQALLIMDQIMSTAPPEFVAALRQVQNKDTWKQAQEGLVRQWLAGTEHPNMKEMVLHHAGGHGFENWSEFCAIVEQNYERWGSPMQRLEAIADPPLVRHVFSHPKAESYAELHQTYQQKHESWFSFCQLGGETHFPIIELPQLVALHLKELVANATTKK
ncbi:hypothetical protein G7054_g6450 [Neopestalotiopsis clavispora]|jgi:pimeloyl-ACP methyl ester carboxylesterase|nr:hypothetical protein G7054_g6450 [Neopestalotiopsis clavispora]